MDILRYENANLNNTAVALGKFQGLHKGHMLLIGEVLRLSYEEDLNSVVFTIDMPQEKAINLPVERYHILEDCGIDYNVSCEFSKEFASMSPREFVENILINKLDAKYVVVGTDFRFGNKRAGDVSLLKSYGEEYGFFVVAIDKLAIDDIIVSSTYIRELISVGNMKAVSRYMGRDYFINGKVMRGKQLGRTIGFPTANIIPDSSKLLPPFGAYYTEVEVEGSIYKAITNVGNNPTIDENNHITVEANIIEFSDDIYDKDITIYFIDFIRGEMKFTDIEELKKQLEIDRTVVLHQ
ncbi:MAG: bifunctional riboflavin kinase/FAD synthetase [Lachnospiraceae bacterium]|nr:bifunctional riboflavin kinase/FAD synthetase [Lachnospiraceae bacterium]